jgi:hypothetical protein
MHYEISVGVSYKEQDSHLQHVFENLGTVQVHPKYTHVVPNMMNFVLLLDTFLFF